MNILITGASSGIALSVVKKINKSDKVYVTTHTDKEARRLKILLKDYNNICIQRLDITNKNDRNRFKNIDIDVLISNAALGIGGSIIDLDIDKMRYNHEVNVFSNYSFIQLILKNMLKKDSGKIIIISSILSEFIMPFLGVYASTKSSISTLGLTLRKEVKMLTNNIDICVIEPGCYHTGFNQVMLNSMYYNMNENSLFYNIRDDIYYKYGLFFKLIERKDLRSISNKIINIIYSNNIKAIYKVPFDQGLFVKIYMLLKR